MYLGFGKFLHRFYILILTNDIIVDSHFNMDPMVVVDEKRIILAGIAVLTNNIGVLLRTRPQCRLGLDEEIRPHQISR